MRRVHCDVSVLMSSCARRDNAVNSKFIFSLVQTNRFLKYGKQLQFVWWMFFEYVTCEFHIIRLLNENKHSVVENEKKNAILMRKDRTLSQHMENWLNLVPEPVHTLVSHLCGTINSWFSVPFNIKYIHCSLTRVSENPSNSLHETHSCEYTHLLVSHVRVSGCVIYWCTAD